MQLERSDEPEGTVLSVSPEEGEKAKASTGITLKVAQAYTVPDVSGMSYNQAAQAIKDAGLSSTAVYVYSETASEGAIMGVELLSYLDHADRFGWVVVYRVLGR